MATATEWAAAISSVSVTGWLIFELMMRVNTDLYAKITSTLLGS